MNPDHTFQVRIQGISKYEGKRKTTHTVHWVVGTNPPAQRSFDTYALADGFRSDLVAATRHGTPFSLSTNLPVTANVPAKMTWFDFATSYVDMKWPGTSGNHRRDIARTLTAVTVAMLSAAPDRFDDVLVRSALRNWAFSDSRDDAPPEEARIIKWVQRNSKPIGALGDPAARRSVATAITTKLDGKPTAGSTAKRNRSILLTACEYAVEIGALDANPVKSMRIKLPKTLRAIDRRCVVNPAQARSLLDAVAVQKPSGRRLSAFFAVIYYAGLRPEEVVALRVHNLQLPEANGWGEFVLSTAAPETDKQWNDSGKRREERQLKQRAANETRHVPCHPTLVRILREHIRERKLRSGDRLFSGVRGGELARATYDRAWKAARKDALSQEERETPLAKRVYDLRHACLTTWLNSGVPAAQVAEWAGNSVPVLQAIYIKCIAGDHDVLKKRIEDALREDAPSKTSWRIPDDHPDGPGHHQNDPDPSGGQRAG